LLMLASRVALLGRGTGSPSFFRLGTERRVRGTHRAEPKATWKRGKVSDKLAICYFKCTFSHGQHYSIVTRTQIKITTNRNAHYVVGPETT
jgi:hypothetical protein